MINIFNYIKIKIVKKLQTRDSTVSIYPFANNLLQLERQERLWQSTIIGIATIKYTPQKITNIEKNIYMCLD